MAWGAVIAGGVALTSAYFSNKDAKDARKEAGTIEQQQLDFEQQRYNDWQSIYGGLQENLGEYFMELSPEDYEVMGLEAYEVEKERALTGLTERLAQRGIDDSGLAAAAELQLENTSMVERANIRRSSEAMVAEDKLRFLQVGLGQNPGDSLSGSLSRQADRLNNRATSAEQAAGAAVGDAVGAIGTALADYANGGNG
jgi:hypothetical protein